MPFLKTFSALQLCTVYSNPSKENQVIVTESAQKPDRQQTGEHKPA